MAKSFEHFGVLEEPLRQVTEAMYDDDKDAAVAALENLERTCTEHGVDIPSYCHHVVSALRARFMPEDDAQPAQSDIHLYQPDEAGSQSIDQAAVEAA